MTNWSINPLTDVLNSQDLLHSSAIMMITASCDIGTPFMQTAVAWWHKNSGEKQIEWLIFLT